MIKWLQERGELEKGGKKAKQEEEAKHREMLRVQHEEIIRTTHQTQQQVGMQMRLSKQCIPQQLQQQQQQRQHRHEINLMQQQQQQTEVLVQVLEKVLTVIKHYNNHDIFNNIHQFFQCFSRNCSFYNS